MPFRRKGILLYRAPLWGSSRTTLFRAACEPRRFSNRPIGQGETGAIPMLAQIAVTIGVVAFAAIVLFGHVLVMTALLTSSEDEAKARRDAEGKARREGEGAAKPSKLGFR